MWAVLKAIEDVASGTMSLVAVTKTRRCSGFGELVADAIAKGEPHRLENIGMHSSRWFRPSRVLMDWIWKPVVTPSLGHDLLTEISHHMEVVRPTSCKSSFEDIS